MGARADVLIRNTLMGESARDLGTTLGEGAGFENDGKGVAAGLKRGVNRLRKRRTEDSDGEEAEAEIPMGYSFQRGRNGGMVAISKRTELDARGQKRDTTRRQTIDPKRPSITGQGVEYGLSRSAPVKGPGTPETVNVYRRELDRMKKPGTPETVNVYRRELDRMKKPGEVVEMVVGRSTMFKTSSVGKSSPADTAVSGGSTRRTRPSSTPSKSSGAGVISGGDSSSMSTTEGVIEESFAGTLRRFGYQPGKHAGGGVREWVHPSGHKVEVGAVMVRGAQGWRARGKTGATHTSTNVESLRSVLQGLHHSSFAESDNASLHLAHAKRARVAVPGDNPRMKNEESFSVLDCLVNEGYGFPASYEIDKSRDILAKNGYAMISSSDPHFAKDAVEGRERYTHPDGTQVHLHLSPDSNQPSDYGKWIFHSRQHSTPGWGHKQLGETLLAHSRVRR